MSVAVSLLLAPWAHLLADLGLHDPLHDGQTQFGRIGFNVLACPGDQLFPRQVCFQTQSFSISCFFFGLFHLSLVFSHLVLLVGCFFCNRPSCLMDGRRTTSNSNYPRDIPVKSAPTLPASAAVTFTPN